MNERKSFEIKLDDAGVGLAKIATLSAVDHDGDTYAKGAFGDQQVMVLAGHSWDGVPLGKGRVFEKGDEAFAEFKLNLDTQAGREWHSALKFDIANGKALQEWSYGFRVEESAEEIRDGKAIRVLQKLEVHEVSPVVKGAGVDTGTVSVKHGRTFEDQIDALIAEAADITKRGGEILDWRKGKGKGKGKGRPFNEDRLAQLVLANVELGALIKRIYKADTPTDQQVAERLDAERLAILCGQNRSKTNG